MDLETPPELVAAIEEELASLRAPLPAQVRALSELFRLFTSERGRLRRFSYLDDPRYRSAYLRYHLPLNAARASCVLAHVMEVHPAVADLEEVVDLGCGPGSASVATLFTLPPRPPRRYTLLDRSRAALRLARKVLEGCAARRDAGGSGLLEARTVAAPLLPPSLALREIPRRAIPWRAMVWVSMVLNELGLGASRGVSRAAFLRSLAAWLDPPSVVLIVEPALRVPARDLLLLHDAAAASGDWRVLAPCTHQRSCPLLRERDRSWCHFRCDWSPPRLVREIADPLGLARDPPSFSYLALERTRGEAGPRPDPERARVIGDRMPLRGGKEGIYICREGKRELVTDLPEDTGRGDIVVRR